MADTIRQLTTLQTNLKNVDAPSMFDEQNARDLAVSSMNGGTALNVADGGTIAHGCPATPYCVQVTGSIANNVVTATTVDGTNITVAIKLGSSGAGGTTQTIYWMAWS